METVAMKQVRALLCTGTRPEIIKMAPVYHALLKTRIKPIVLHIGQHSELAEDLYTFFNMPPDRVFDIDRQRQSLGHLFSLLSDKLDSYLSASRPELVIVQGDTSSAFAAALAAFYHRIPVAHIEAGLRSHHTYDPFPEEKHRELIARLARWHFVPTMRANRNLQKEGILSVYRHHVGNTIVDAVNWSKEKLKPVKHELIEKLHLPEDWFTNDNGKHRIVLVTAHRRESWDSGITKIAEGIRDIVMTCPEIRVIWPLHPNPVIVDAVHAVMSTLNKTCADRIRITSPLFYPELLWLLQRTWLVLTDSGGLQEEAITLRVPVLVLRDTTERPEVIEVSGGVLIGKEPDDINRWLASLLQDDDLYQSLKSTSNPFGDGNAGEYIADRLEYDLLTRDKHKHATDQ
jgi:UDP-N-acetylglucosamine 2-epimerase